MNFSLPVRARIAALGQDPGYLRRVLRDGNERATAIAEQTLDQVRAAMGAAYAGSA